MPLPSYARPCWSRLEAAEVATHISATGSSTSPRQVLRFRYFLAVLVAGWLAYFLAEHWLIAYAQIDLRYSSASLPAGVVAAVLRKAMVIFTLLAGCVWTACRFRAQLRPIAEQRFFPVLVTIGSSAMILLCLHYQGRERTFYPLIPLIEHPENYPIFGHRVLFLWVGQLAHHLHPSLDSKTLLIVSQLPAVLFTTVMSGLWSAAIVGRRVAYLGQFFLLAFLLPTISYYNFYDIGIVGFYAATFLAAWRRRFWITVPLIAIATLNHENALFLVPAIGLAAALSEPYRKVIAVCGAALAAHFAVRLTLWHFMPMSHAGDLRLYSNAVWIAGLSSALAVAAAILLFRWLCALVGWKYAPPLLKRLAIVWPLLFLATLVFGQLTEARQFNGDIPLAIALVLVYVRQGYQSESQPGLRVDVLAYGESLPDTPERTGTMKRRSAVTS